MVLKASRERPTKKVKDFSHQLDYKSTSNIVDTDTHVSCVFGPDPHP